jgi:hypothetical protein
MKKKNSPRGRKNESSKGKGNNKIVMIVKWLWL